MLGSARSGAFRLAAVTSMIMLAAACATDATATGEARSATPGGPVVSSPRDAATTPSPTPAYRDTVTPIDGVYASIVTERDASAAGIPRSAYTEIVGDYELDLDHGDLRLLLTHGVTYEVLGGTYEVHGDELTISNGDVEMVLRWERDGRDLHLTVLRATEGPRKLASDRTTFGSHVWERIL